jgi:hypothetical protein
MTADAWPVAELGPLARLRALSAGLPGTWLVERTIDAPFDDVWGFLSDLERSAPAFDTDVHALQIRKRDGDRLRIRANGPWWALHAPLGFDVELRPGWCWMVSPLYVVGMAAEPDGDRTHYGHLEGVVGHRRWLRPLLAASRYRHRHHVPRDVDGIERALGRRDR